MKVKVSLDTAGYRTKEESISNAGSINNRLALEENHIYLRSADDFRCFLDKAGNRGYAFSPATNFNNSREDKDDNFEQTQIFCIDLDNNSPDKTITLKQAFERAYTYNLPVLAAYETLRSENCNRFRILFLSDGSIDNKKAAEFMINALLTIFPEADKACGNVLRMYFGGKKLLYFDEDIPAIDVEKVDIALGSYLKDRYGITHYKRELYKLSLKCGISVDRNGMLDIQAYDDFAAIPDEIKNGKNLPNPFVYIYGNGNFLPRYYIINFTNTADNSNNIGAEAEISDEAVSGQKEKKSKGYHKYLRESEIPALRMRCQLFRVFESGNEWLYHNELYGLATNMVHVDKGKEIFLAVLLNVLKKHPNYWSYKYKHSYFKNHCLSYMEKKYTCPQSCSKFCPYADECERAKDIISTVKVKNHEIEKLANYVEKYVTIDEAVEDFRKQFRMAMESTLSGVNVLRAQTSLGKTEIYIEYMLISLKALLIAVPTNLLKDDVYERIIKRLGVEEIRKHPEYDELTGEGRRDKIMELGAKKVMKTPSLQQIMEMPEHKNNPILQEKWRIIQGLYNSGKHKKVIPTIKKMIQQEDIPVLRDYMEELEKVGRFDGHIITTHERLLHMSKQYLQNYEIIIDEDILKTVFNKKVSVNIYDLKMKLKCRNFSSPAVDKLIQAYEQSKKAAAKDIFFKLPQVELDKETADMSWGFDISAFCEASWFCCCLQDCSIVAVKPAQFHDLKYTVVSATADKTIYEYYFSREKVGVHFHECQQARYMGELIQYYDRTMSRYYMRGHLEAYIEIERELGKMPRITFKEFAGGDLIHIGATEGCDFYKGLNICVIGTLHFPPWLYKLIAYTIGLDFDEKDELESQEVTHNGCRFKFMTYRDEVLRSIQFYLIEGELEQAVGRARLLRFECTVNLFSNFPLRQATLMKFKG